jgi:putative flippase GtrA
MSRKKKQTGIIATLEKLLRRYVPPALLRYLLVGGFGCLVNAGGLELLNRGFNVEVHISYVVAMIVAIASTYPLHRHYTFTDAHRPKRAGLQFAAFGITQVSANGLNFAVFSLVLWLLPKPLPLIPAVIAPDFANLFSMGWGVIAGLCANWLILRFFVFPEAKKAGGSKP